jgi:hypothetical protein
MDIQNGRESKADEIQARTPLRDLLVEGLKTSSVLCMQLPRVRRLALIQTLQSSARGSTTDTATSSNRDNTTVTLVDIGKRIDKEALQIILYNVQTSPYLTQEQFQDVVLGVLNSPSSSSLNPQIVNLMAERMLDGDWEGLLAISIGDSDATLDSAAFASSSIQSNSRSQSLPTLSCLVDSDTSHYTGKNEAVRCFREMVVEILSTSRKITDMEVTRRRALSSKIHSASSIDKVTQVALEFLNTSEIFPTNSDQRHEIKDLILKGRFDIMVLPKYFDCEEKPRRQRRGDQSGRNNGYNFYHVEEMDCFDASDIEDDECVICLGEIDQSEMTILFCNHRFCTECIYAWTASTNNSTCPTCRGPIHSGNVGVINQNGHDEVTERIGNYPPLNAQIETVQVGGNLGYSITNTCLTVYTSCVKFVCGFIVLVFVTIVISNL